jgi:hypothetical protein
MPKLGTNVQTSDYSSEFVKTEALECLKISDLDMGLLSSSLSWAEARHATVEDKMHEPENGQLLSKEW